MKQVDIITGNIRSVMGRILIKSDYITKVAGSMSRNMRCINRVRANFWRVKYG